MVSVGPLHIKTKISYDVTTLDLTYFVKELTLPLSKVTFSSPLELEAIRDSSYPHLTLFHTGGRLVKGRLRHQWLRI